MLPAHNFQMTCAHGFRMICEEWITSIKAVIKMHLQKVFFRLFKRTRSQSILNLPSFYFNAIMILWLHGFLCLKHCVCMLLLSSSKIWRKTKKNLAEKNTNTWDKYTLTPTQKRYKTFFWCWGIMTSCSQIE